MDRHYNVCMDVECVFFLVTFSDSQHSDRCPGSWISAVVDLSIGASMYTIRSGNNQWCPQGVAEVAYQQRATLGQIKNRMARNWMGYYAFNTFVFFAWSQYLHSAKMLTNKTAVYISNDDEYLQGKDENSWTWYLGIVWTSFNLESIHLVPQCAKFCT